MELVIKILSHVCINMGSSNPDVLVLLEIRIISNKGIAILNAMNDDKHNLVKGDGFVKGY